MKDQTFGVEIEMNHITRDAAARIVAEYFGTENTVKYIGAGYFTWICKDTKGRTWQFQRDVSIAGDNEHKCEMATPILMYDDMEDLQEIVRRLRHAGAISNPNNGCGVHIHIGAKGQTPKTIRNLVNLMESHEQLITRALKLDARRLGRWCQTVDPNFLKAINEKKPDTMEKLSDVWYESQNCSWDRNAHYNASRYHMLNLHATFTKGTIEFRLFQFNNPGHNFKGGLHAGMLKSYVQFCLALCDRAKKVKYATYRPLQSENDKYTMRVWLLHLGFIGDEFKTARDILTRNLTGDAAHRYGRNNDEFWGVAI